MHYGRVISPAVVGTPPTVTSAPQPLTAVSGAPMHHHTVSPPRLPDLSSPKPVRQSVSTPQSASQSVTVPAGLYSAPPVIRPVPTVPTRDARNERWTPSRL